MHFERYDRTDMKRLLTMVLMLTLLLALLPGAVSALESEPAPELKITASPAALSWDGISTRSYHSTVSLAAGSTVTLTPTDPGQKISALYIVWSKVPGSWALGYNGKSETFGQNGYLHEFVALEGGAEEVTLTVEGDESLCFIRAFGPGELPSDVQIWEPVCEKADILVLPAHADDEILFFGGILAEYAGQQDLAVQVAYFSQYEYGIREHEKLDGIWTCGVRHYPVSGPFPDVYQETPDQARAYFKQDAALAFYLEQLRRFQPQVCIVHDAAGEYGNGTHQFVVQVLREALEQSSDPAVCPESAEQYGVWDVPKTYLHLWKENPIHLDCRRSLSAFDGKTALEVAAEAYKKHVSQQQLWFYVSDEGPYSIAQFGLYRTTVGPDTGSDIMEHLVPYAQQSEVPPEVTESTQAPPATQSEPEPTQPEPTQASAETAPAQTPPTAEEGKPLLPILLAAISALLTVSAVVALCVVSIRRRM